MLTTSEIKNQSLKYIAEHLQYENFTDKQVTEAHNGWSRYCSTLKKLYGRSDKLYKSDVFEVFRTVFRTYLFIYLKVHRGLWS